MVSRLAAPDPAEELAKKPHTSSEPRPDRYLKRIISEHLEDYRLHPLPAALKARAGVHPRLFLSPSRIPELRRLIETDAAYRHMGEKLCRVADRLAGQGPDPYFIRQEEIDEAAWLAVSYGGCPTMMFYNEVKRETSKRR